MIENKKLVIILFCFIWAAILIFGFWSDRSKPIGAKEALRIASALPVVKSFKTAVSTYALDSCVEQQVVRPCDTDWVTCIEEAWVVQFSIDKTCHPHDGRLSVTVVVNGLDRDIISVFPEKQYFVRPRYCLEDYDCLCDRQHAFNFVFGQLQELTTARPCDCEKNICTP